MNRKVERPEIQKFHSAIIDGQADMGFFITTAEFSDPAIEYSADKSIELWNGEKLIQEIQEVMPKPDQLWIDVMCLECGEVVKFEFQNETNTSCCSKGHSVKFDKTLYSPINEFLKSKTAYSRRRRYYR